MVVWEADAFENLMTAWLEVMNEIVFSGIAFQEWRLLFRRKTLTELKLWT